MSIVLRETKEAKAKKQHVCNFCFGAIEIGQIYDSTVMKHDDVYTWKAHPRCGEIAYKLKMFDDCDDEGLTADTFQEYIREEFKEIWSIRDNEYYKSKSFVFPKFKEQLDFVCQHHLTRANDVSGTPQPEGRGVQADSVLKRHNNHPFLIKTSIL